MHNMDEISLTNLIYGKELEVLLKKLYYLLYRNMFSRMTRYFLLTLTKLIMAYLLS